MATTKPLHMRYTPLPSATPEGERSALADCYRIVLEDYDVREATESNGQDGITTEIQTEK